MRKTRALLVLLIATIFLLTLNSQNCWAAYTPSGSGFPLMGGIEIDSPCNTTYFSGVLTLNASVKSMAGPTYNYQFVYSIDGQENASLHLSSNFVPVEANVRYANGTTEKRVSQIFSYYVFSGLTALPKYAQGQHNLTVYGIYERTGSNTNWPALLWDKQSVNFTVNLRSTS